MPRFLFLFCCSLFSLILLQGQANTYDRLHLRVGKTVYGEVIDWEYGGELIFRDTSGQVVNYPPGVFRRVTFSKLRAGSSPSEDRLVRTPNVRTASSNDWFQHIEMAFSFGKREEDGFFFNPNSNAIVGYQIAAGIGRKLTPRIEATVNLMYATYTRSRRERTAGTSLQARYLIGNLFEGPNLFVQMEGGYELPIGTDDQKIIERKGGIAVHPSIGLLLGNSGVDTGRLSVDLGYRFLETSYRATTFRGSELRSPKYRRLVLRAGYTF